MKFGAHPLVVAVALGLLGPSALADVTDEDVDIETKRSPHLDEPVAELVSELQPASPDDYARVAAEWHEARGLI